MLSTKRLVKAIAAVLTEYREAPGKTLGAVALFYKPFEDLVLSLGIETSKRYVDRFTGSFYLSRSFSWAYMPPWFPRKAYARIGHFLSAEERSQLLEKEFTGHGVVDAWWIADEEGVRHFSKAVAVAEKRFLAQHEIVDALRGNVDLDAYISILDAIAARAGSVSTERAGGRDMPIAWHVAAEVVLRQRGEQFPKATLVDLVSTDAWRRNVSLQ